MAKKLYKENEISFIEKPEKTRFIDLSDRKFGRLTILGFCGKGNRSQSYWFCKCECGNIIKSRGSHLVNNLIVSCGCYGREILSKCNRTHGHTSGGASKVYRCWKSMLKRCTNPKDKGYKNYGGRGITVCDRWHKFENFLEDIGEPPTSKHCIERINNDGNYDPINCKWATRYEQSNNRRCNVLFTFNDKTQNIVKWSIELGINKTTLLNRIKIYKWPIERVFTTPPIKPKKCQSKFK